jgi:hypothetical protein
LLVHKPHVLLNRDEARLITRVESETRAFAPFDLSLGVPRAYLGWLNLSGNGVLPPLHLLAWKLGERLRSESPVSSRLLASAEKACRLYQSWAGRASVAVEAEPLPPDLHPAPGGAALFFTRGVDSWFSALKARAGSTPERITHLIYVRNIARPWSEPTRRRALELTREAAACLGWPLIPVSYNGRDLLDRFLSWENCHGCVLASMGLALGNGLAGVVIAAGQDVTRPAPFGTAPQFLSLWSTEQTSVRVDGCEARRVDKVQDIARSLLAVPRLQVCWEADTATNCGACEKCVRTQTALAAVGALPRASSFERSLTPEAVRRFAGRLSSTAACLWEELLDCVSDDTPPAGLKPAVQELVSSGCCAVSAPTPGPARPQAVFEVHCEAAVSLLPAPYRQVLPGPVRAARGSRLRFFRAPRVEICWGPASAGRKALPLRPLGTEGPLILRQCQHAAERSARWCLIDVISPLTTDLILRLTDAWGSGILCLAPQHAPDTDHGTARIEAARVQRHSRVRVWYSATDRLDPFRVLESLRHGCLPQQFMDEEAYSQAVRRLPQELTAFVQPLPRQGRVPPLSPEDWDDRLDRGLSVVLAGSLERDLAQVLPAFRRRMP